MPLSDPVAVVGMGIVVPGAADPDEFWALLGQGRSVVDDPGERWPRAGNFLSPDSDAEDRAYTCRGGFVRNPELNPTASAEPDAVVRWLRHSIAQAYANIAVGAGDRVAAYVATTADANEAFEETLLVDVAARRIAAHWPGSERAADVLELVRKQLRVHYPNASDHLRAHAPHEALRASIAGLLPESTPVVGVDTACSSGLYAVDLGAKALLAGDVDVAVCAGVQNLTIRNCVEFSKLGGLSRLGHVRSLGDDADGTLFAEGAATVVLKSLAKARRDGDPVLAVLGGFGAASDGRGKAVFTPSASGQQRALSRACEAGAIAVDDLDWCVAHATGTPTGDGVEIGVLNGSLTTRGHLCTSTKAVLGHTGWAAGTVSLIHAILGLRNNVVPAHNPIGDVRAELRDAKVTVPRTPVAFATRPDRPRAVGVAAFGFGGTNAYQIVRDEPRAGQAVPRSGPARDDDGVVLVAWSAHLPGSPSSHDVLARARAGLALSDASFGPAHPELPAGAGRLTPITVRTVDRTQLMALAVAHRFAAEHGALWGGLTETIGVFTAHSGPPDVLGDVTMRAYRHDLTDLPVTLDGLRPDHWARAVADAVAALRRERPPTNEDTLAGHMPNVVPARIAAHLDLHGPAVTLDAGTSSTQFAVHTAIRYLSTREVDLALVLALNGATTDEAASCAGARPGELAEGAFLFALARSGDAARHGWPVVGTLSSDLHGRASATRRPRRRTYSAAEGAVDLVELVARDQTGTLSEAPAITFTPVTAPAAGTGATTTPAATPGATTARHVTFWERHPASERTPEPSSAPDAILTDEVTAGLLDPTASVFVLRGNEDPVTAVDRLPGSLRHLRVIVARAGQDVAPPSALRLHEVLFLAVQRNHRTLGDGGSIGVAVLDELSAGVPAPHTGLFTGFVKSMAWELPGCASHTTITDADPVGALQELATELVLRGGLPVTLHQRGVRHRQRITPVTGTTGTLPLRPGSVVVAVGGARGITAAVVEALARDIPLTVWLLGSSQPDEVPPELLAAPDDDLQRHRAAFIAERAGGTDPRPIADLNREFDRLVRARETACTVARLRERLGAKAVRYLPVDVTDAEAVRRAAATVAAEHDAIDLLINGVGLHRPADLERKTLASFRLVRDVKVEGYRNLRQAFPDVRLWCNFGSVTGLVGHPGEVDYSSANDFLAHAAQHGQAVHGHDEHTIAWAIWKEVGLAAEELARGFLDRARHSSDMSKDEGVTHFLAELAQRSPRDALVTFIGEHDHRSSARLFPGFLRHGRAGHFLREPLAQRGDRATWRLTVDPGTERYLADHLVDGVPTLPGTMLVAIAAEAAGHFAPGVPVRSFRDIRFPVWVRGRKAREYAVEAARVPGGAVLVRLLSRVTTPDGRLLKEQEHFRATVDTDLPPPPQATRTGWWRAPNAEPVHDPYYGDESRVRLAGPFRPTRNRETHDLGATALWQPDVDGLPEVFAELPIPSLLLDALARTKALHVVDGVHQVIIPTRVRRIELEIPASDAELASLYPDGIQLHWTGPTATWSALASDGSLVARIIDMDTAPFGQVRHRATPLVEDSRVYRADTSTSQ
ncbi:SDR family NAD(P)-dependent oxidoreductase [Actinosynnema sp. NPDC050436]|uniref:SDR family NAD(P)-dependent oxidoreductase n=1 Tax=Actinosynnema sp. NPDC050436 TaxID=3155659 RepID=UPI0033DADB71